MRCKALHLAAGLIAASLAWAAPAAARDYTAAEMRLLGYQVMASGDAMAAREIADALLRRDPRDASALLLRAQALQALQDEPGARSAARLAYRAAGTKDSRFSAAMFLANSFSASKNNNRAQLWLRKASQAAPDDMSGAYAQDMFDAVRSRNPLILNFDLSIRPSSNVNNGSSETSFRNPGIPWLPPEIPIAEEQLALSGAVARVAADLTYRLPPTATTRTEFLLHFDQSLVWLSPEAYDIAPEARAGNYATAAVEVGVVRLYRPLQSPMTYRFGLFAGHDWSGGSDLSNRLRLEVSGDLVISPNLHGLASVSVERQERLDASIRSATITGLTFGLSKRQKSGDVLRFSVTGRQVDTESPGLENTAFSARLNWDKAKPVLGMGLSMSATAEHRDYPFSPYNPAGGRQDDRLALTMTLDLQQVTYMAFSPTVSVIASDTRSNVDLFSARDFGINLGFKSKF